MSNSVTNTTPTNYLYGTNTTTPPSQTLDKNAFLQLLVTQLQNQDPTQPMDNSQFISQMAQFSALEQMNNVATSMDNVAQINSMAYGSQLMGNEVTYTADDGSTQSGIVSSVQLVSGNVQVQVGSQMVDLSSIVSITKPGEATTSPVTDPSGSTSDPTSGTTSTNA